MLVSIEEQVTFVEQIKTGSEAFSCPLHRCFTCKKGDIKENDALRLYGCRRCPRAWHKQCISNKLAFYDGEWVPGLRGWEMNGMRFLYCLRHEMDEDLGTPVRNHLVFPKGPSIGYSSYASLKKERKLSAEKTAPSLFQQASHTKHNNLPAISKVHKMGSLGRMGTKIIQKSPAPAIKKSSVGINSVTSPKTKIFPSFNEEVKKMIESIIDTSKKVVTFDTVVANLSVPIVYKEPIGSVRKNLCLGKLDSILHALMKSRECLLRGAIEEARCIFPEESIRILERSKNKLRVYLAPILHGVRYTSYGRHFTKLEKLQEIVNRLHWYVDDGDMVVDFCCGSNDFSRLMVEKLTQCRKDCEYKNFDIIQPKHDFNFTKRDWLSVKKHELPSGDKLIMGLNPPFGVFAQLANTMVQHALTFKPKLLILIVPKETKRLEYCGYECIWEDPYLLSGQAFYFPGSVDINDKSLSQENFDVPPLYLWSRSDWATRHRQVAAEQGHLENSIPLRTDMLHPVPQVWSTRRFETQPESRIHEWRHFTDQCAVPAKDFDPSKIMIAGAEHHVRGEFNQQQREKIFGANTPDYGAQIKPQHRQQSESPSHYRKLVDSWNKDPSGNQMVFGQELQELEMVPNRQPEDPALDLDSCEEAPRQFVSAFEEHRRFAMGRQYPGCEILVQTRSFTPDRPCLPSSRPYHDFQLYNRTPPELAFDGHTGGWIED
ncbi:hypothetical protein O6H91_13G031800 [Diphasiastrum complanatum]|nr:hypothetical protein O6H91_13G031800 [Diphasiastrum complanatum]